MINVTTLDVLLRTFDSRAQDPAGAPLSSLRAVLASASDAASTQRGVIATIGVIVNPASLFEQHVLPQPNVGEVREDGP